MADGEITQPQGDEPAQGEAAEESQERPAPKAEFRMEMRDTLPGDRAVVGVEQEGEFVWLASRKYVHPKAVDEFVEHLQRIVGEGWWVQNWPGSEAGSR